MTKLGKFEIIEKVGQGALGVVYKARDSAIGRIVALKTLTKDLSEDPDLLDRFYLEARAAGTLQHPNIVTIYEIGHEKNTSFIAMEYIEGESLDRIIEQHAVLPFSVKLGYIVRVCSALAYAHQHSVVHRDVKPANIMVTKEGVVKVVDFGIARLTDMSLTQPNMMIGSRAYMSPQLYKGERADARSDIWAVGVSLYELLAYRRPFTGENEAELMFHIIYEKPEDLLSLSPECTEGLLPIINKMLEKKSEDRYQSMEDLLHAIEPIWKAAQQATVSGLLADCQELVAAKDLERAQALLRKALHIDVGNTQAKSMLERVSVELRRTDILPRLQEHLNRGEGFLKAGQLREAKGEAQAALGLDSKHEPAHKLLAEVEAAAAKTQQQEQKRKEEGREKQIQGFLMCERYGEALETARKAIEEFPKQDAFRKLATEAEALKKEQDDRERARNEMQRRVREINSKINQDKITDAIDLAEQTMGADPNVTQLLQGAEEKRKKMEDAERKVTALQTLVNKGDHAGATKLFNEVLATQILQPSDPRLLELRGKISSLGGARQTGGTQIYPPKTSLPKPSSPGKNEQPAAAKPVLPPGDMTQVSESTQNIPEAGFSATRVIGSGDRPAAQQDGGVSRRSDSEGKDAAARKTEVPGATVIAGPGVRQAPTPSGVTAEPRQSGETEAKQAADEPSLPMARSEVNLPSPVRVQTGLSTPASTSRRRFLRPVWIKTLFERINLRKSSATRTISHTVAADPVHFGVTSHRTVSPGTSFVVNVWAYVGSQRKEVKKRAEEALGGTKPYMQSIGPAMIRRGTLLSMRLKMEELTVAEPEATLVWEGEIGSATFSVVVANGARTGSRAGVVKVYADGLQIATVHFAIRVGRKTSRSARLGTRELRYHSAFASYASEDRDAVLARIQGIQKAAPDLDVFLDVLKLRSGEDWEQKLWKEIPARDVFYLFWSECASQSNWVEKEWKCALKTRGLDFIDPVPLVSPDTVPPPQELASKHFNDWVLAFMRSSRS
jgi:serine/threonine protein kinase